jgi:hypothetical protein
MAVGFGIAVLVVLAAVFQEVVVGAARVGRYVGVRVLAPVLHATGQVARRLGRGAIALFSPASSPPSSSERPSRPTSSRRSADRIAVPDPAPQPEPNRSPPLPSTEEVVPPATSERQPEASRQAKYGLYSPASSLLIEEEVGNFLRERGGSASLEALVRRLEREFGVGLGGGIVEALRNRGVLEVRRDPSSATRLIAVLAENSGAPGDAVMPPRPEGPNDAP